MQRGLSPRAAKPPPPRQKPHGQRRKQQPDQDADHHFGGGRAPHRINLVPRAPRPTCGRAQKRTPKGSRFAPGGASDRAGAKYSLPFAGDASDRPIPSRDRSPRPAAGRAPTVPGPIRCAFRTRPKGSRFAPSAGTRRAAGPKRVAGFHLRTGPLREAGSPFPRRRGRAPDSRAARPLTCRPV